MARIIMHKMSSNSLTHWELLWGKYGAWPYNRPCAQQYAGKSLPCMVVSGRLVREEGRGEGKERQAGTLPDLKILHP